ncbi:hypothetical protein [Pseudoxanthomonas winnipegensis]|uniref:Pectate lyase superfamily protein domain-containing protein n=1 Tax=Pseudoxanthomonas winnipegensis TaxID=2480810 RepID=A0A4Q8L8H8_9GAMM|nr:hypothetical protein [Pseudoxanthomonas winnipegensis]RZZ81114.1 hypothetical protein EA662_19225 [Pseudoxanthomonas winnipegensis]TAA24059.1 hypothetical protein EA661_19570 [Pseudoxanthomonas winnipegensis]TBV71468.1 hypothetical protein EYC46_17705 [Pseudoxanthomonas winnipegensis]
MDINDTIPERDLPVGSPSDNDYMRGTRRSDGKSFNYPMSSFPAGALSFTAPGIGTTARKLSDKLGDYATVEDWGAVGDGVTDDSAAVLAMIADTGTLRLLAKSYRVGNLSIPERDSLSIIGAGMPKPNSGLTALVGGSILIGDISANANTLHLEGFGIDHGAARGLGYAPPGNFFNTRVNQVGVYAYVQSVAALGSTSSNTPRESHGLALQGFDRNSVDNVYFGRHYHGLVLKGRNGTVRNVIMDDIGYAGVFVKSDTPAYGGGTSNATAIGIAVSDVALRAASANTVAVGVYVMASTDAVSQVQISKVSQSYGLAPVRLHGGGLISDPALSQVQVSAVRSDRSQLALQAIGYTYDWVASDIIASNPATGKVVSLAGTSSGWKVTDAHLVATQALGGTLAFELNGSGAYSNLSARTAGTTYTVSVGTSLTQIATGAVTGDLVLATEAALTGINGATASASPNAPVLKVLPGTVVKLGGRFNLTGSSNKFFCNIPINTGKQMVFACAGIDSGGNYVTAAVRLNDFQLSIEPSLPTGFQQIDLGGITIPMR